MVSLCAMRPVQYNRKTNPKIKNGKVHQKNNGRLTPWRGFVVDRETPKKGYRHLVTKRDIFDFIELLPDWRDLVDGLERIKLSAGDDEVDAFYQHFDREGTGAIDLAAWDNELIHEIPTDYFDEHRGIFQKIELKYERRRDGVVCWFDEAKARAFILVHIFLHELGHHLDKKRGGRVSSGESYAEDFANRMEDVVWPLYVKKFGKP
jgi:hypothetical protein